MFVLEQYAMEKPRKDGWDYNLIIPYETDEQLDKIVYDILQEAASIADSRHCFIEADARAMDGSDRAW